MDGYVKFVLANHIQKGEALCELDLDLLLRSGMIARRDVARLPAPGASCHSQSLFWYQGDRYDAVLLNEDPVLVPAITHGPRSGRGLLELHLATGAPLERSDVSFIAVSRAADEVDFEDRGGLWYHHSIPTQVVHVAVCCVGPMILGVTPHASLEDARDTVLFFLKTTHGLPEDLAWDEWTEIVREGIAPSETGQTGVWSVPVEAAPHAQDD